MLHLFIHFQVFPDFESWTVLCGPLIQEISQVISHSVELAKLKVNYVFSLIRGENVAKMAVIVA